MIHRLVLTAAIIALAGCTTNVSRFQMPDTDLAGIQYLYVNAPGDDRQAEELLSLVRSGLEGRGYKVAMNGESVTFGQGDYVFDYTTDWHWDITWYLLDFRVAIYEPETDTLIAQAHSQQSSLARKSVEVIVERALASLFDDAPEAKGDTE